MELMDVFFLSPVAAELVEASDCVDGERRTLNDDLLEYASSVLCAGICDNAGTATVEGPSWVKVVAEGNRCGVVVEADSTAGTDFIAESSSSTSRDTWFIALSSVCDICVNLLSKASRGWKNDEQHPA